MLAVAQLMENDAERDADTDIEQRGEVAGRVRLEQGVGRLHEKPPHQRGAHQRCKDAVTARADDGVDKHRWPEKEPGKVMNLFQ